MFVFSPQNGEKSTEPINSRESEVSSLSAHTFLEVANLPDVMMKLVIQIDVIDAEVNISRSFRREHYVRGLLYGDFLTILIIIDHSCIRQRDKLRCQQ